MTIKANLTRRGDRLHFCNGSHRGACGCFTDPDREPSGPFPNAQGAMDFAERRRVMVCVRCVAIVFARQIREGKGIKA